LGEGEENLAVNSLAPSRERVADRPGEGEVVTDEFVLRTSDEQSPLFKRE
jgi:hypothetical protein